VNTQYQTTFHSVPERKTRKKAGPSAFIFLIVWMLLIGCGIMGAIWYSEKIKQSITTELTLQTARQITTMQTEYDKQLKQLETDYKGSLAVLQNKVDALNELLEFSKANINDKTDNSNKLFSQLSEVKKQLNELKQSLDVLK